MDRRGGRDKIFRHADSDSFLASPMFQIMHLPSTEAGFVRFFSHSGTVIAISVGLTFCLRAWMILANVGFLLTAHLPRTRFATFLAQQHAYQRVFGILLIAGTIAQFAFAKAVQIFSSLPPSAV